LESDNEYHSLDQNEIKYLDGVFDSKQQIRKANEKSSVDDIENDFKSLESVHVSSDESEKESTKSSFIANLLNPFSTRNRRIRIDCLYLF
jgi:hypothetical protein